MLLQKINFDNTRWLDNDHPVEVNKEFVKDNFLPYEELIIILSLKHSVFDQQTLISLEGLSKELQDNDKINHVKTPVTAQIIVSDDHKVTLTNFISAYENHLLKTKNDVEKAFSDSIYHKILAPEKLDQAVIVIYHELPGKLSKYMERGSIIAEVSNIVSKYDAFVGYKLAGKTFLSYHIDQLNISNLTVLLFLALILVIVVLLVIYRNIIRVVLILLSSICCLIYSLMIFKLFARDIDIISMILPILVIVISLSDSIFINARAELLLNKYPNKKLFLKALITQTKLPCFLTSLTTAIGFGSFYFSEITPLHNLSYLAIISIMGSYIIIVCINWISIYFLFNKLKDIIRLKNQGKYFDKLLYYSKSIIELHYRKILLFSIVIVFFFAFGLFKIYTETNFIKIFFKENHPVVQHHQLIDDNYYGSSTVDLIILDKNFTFQDITDFNRLKNIKDELEGLSLVKKILSYHDIVSMVHRGFIEDEKYPLDSLQLEQELLFLEFSKNDNNSDVLEPYLNFPKTSSRMEIKTNNLTSTEINELIAGIDNIVKKSNLAEEDYFLAGNNIYFYFLSKYIISTQLISVLITFIFITLVIFIMFDIKIALLSTIPNFFPPLITLGAVSWLNIPFDFSTILIASISFGITIDSSIHLIHVYQSLRKSNISDGDIRAELLKIVGRPIIVSCIVFSLIFSLFIFSDIVMLIKFGIFSCFAVVISLIVNLLVIPAILSQNRLSHQLLVGKAGL